MNMLLQYQLKKVIEILEQNKLQGFIYTIDLYPTNLSVVRLHFNSIFFAAPKLYSAGTAQVTLNRNVVYISFLSVLNCTEQIEVAKFLYNYNSTNLAIKNISKSRFLKVFDKYRTKKRKNNDCFQ